MRRLALALAAIAAALAPARADYLILDANKNPLSFKSSVLAGIHFGWHVVADSSGNALFTFANPGQVTVGSSVLPTGAATAANQATANTALSGILSAVQGPTPAGTNTIGAVTQAGAPWSVSQSGAPWSVSVSNTIGLASGSALVGGVQLVDSGGSNKVSISGAGALKTDCSPGCGSGSTAGSDGQAGSAVTESVAGLLNAGGTVDRRRAAVGTTGIAAVDTESTKATYVASVTVNLAASPTDFFVLQGSGTKTIRVRRITVSAASGNLIFQAIRRSSANSGGTSSTVTVGKFDTSDASATAAATIYTANPTSLGTQVAVLHSQYMLGSTTATPTALDLSVSNRNDRAIVLRGTSDYLALNGSGSGSGGSTYINVEWTEE